MIQHFQLDSQPEPTCAACLWGGDFHCHHHLLQHWHHHHHPLQHCHCHPLQHSMIYDLDIYHRLYLRTLKSLVTGGRKGWKWCGGGGRGWGGVWRRGGAPCCQGGKVQVAFSLFLSHQPLSLVHFHFPTFTVLLFHFHFTSFDNFASPIYFFPLSLSLFNFHTFTSQLSLHNSASPI